MNRAFLVGVFPIALLAGACGYDNGHVNRVDTPASSCSSATPADAKIDTGAGLEVDAGQGAGIFVEYSTDGHWQVRTSCDTLKTNRSCVWDVIVTPEDGSSITNIAGAGLEPDDSLGRYTEDRVSYQLVASTSSDIDGFTFDSNPGAAILVDAYLDDTCALGYFYWVGDGALHSGSPTNPLILVPSSI